MSIKNIKRQIKSYLSRDEAIILTYHSVLPKDSTLIDVAHHIHADLFEQHMKYFAESKYNCVSLSEISTSLDTGKLPKNSIVITFDDGFANNLHVALPILKKYRIPATFFISTDFLSSGKLNWPEELAIMLSLSSQTTLKYNNETLDIGDKNKKSKAYKHIASSFGANDAVSIRLYLDSFSKQLSINTEDVYSSQLFDDVRFLTRQELIELNDDTLVDVGSHTHTHRRLIHLSNEDSREEIVKSKEILEDMLGDCKSFAFPFGGENKDFNAEHLKMAQNANYKTIVTCNSDTVNKNSSAHKLPRTNINYDCDIDQLDYLIRGGIYSRKNKFSPTLAKN